MWFGLLFVLHSLRVSRLSWFKNAVLVCFDGDGPMGVVLVYILPVHLSKLFVPHCVVQWICCGCTSFCGFVYMFCLNDVL